MTVDRLINVLVTITLIEMMFAVGLSVTVAEIYGAARNRWLIGRVLVANYVVFPAATVLLLMAFHPLPMVSAGFLILAVCPGAPYGPPFTSIARGNVALAIGLMVILAMSSAIVAPLLLSALLPLVSGDHSLNIDSVKLVGTLLVTQIIPLSAGLLVRERRPRLADQLLKPANFLSKLLNLLAVVLIAVARLPAGLPLEGIGLTGMLVLLAASLVAGYLQGGPEPRQRRTVALTTSLRNVAVSLVIASGSFPGTPALAAVLAYGAVEILGSLLLALWWRRAKSAA